MKLFASKYIDRLTNTLRKISLDEIENFSNLLCNARKNQNTIFFIGNGGSAATASHFANDLAIGLRNEPFKAISLCDNVAKISAIGNDFGYDEIFSKQLNVFGNAGDILVAISASGNSPNLLKAIKVAKTKKMTTVGLTSFDGGSLKKEADFNVHVPTDIGEYGLAEDAHMILDHLLSNYFIEQLR